LSFAGAAAADPAAIANAMSDAMSVFLKYFKISPNLSAFTITEGLDLESNAGAKVGEVGIHGLLLLSKERQG
jgi:hypothetical protein